RKPVRPALETAEGEQLERPLASLPLLAADARRPHDAGQDAALQVTVHADEHVLERRHLAEEPDVLEGAADAAVRDRVRRLPGDVAAVEHDPARGGRVDAGE